MAEVCSNVSDFQKHFPEPETLLTLEPEELAGYLLEFFHSITETDRQRNVMRYEWLGSPQPVDDYPPKFRDQIAMALMEAWSWLERQGLIARSPHYMVRGSYFITKQGGTLSSPWKNLHFHAAVVEHGVNNPAR